MKYEMIKDYEPQRFRQVTGVLPEIFEEMVEILQKAYKAVHQKRNGRNRKLSCEDMLLMTLEYYKEYRTMECIGASYGLAKINVSKGIRWVEKVLAESGKYTLVGKKKLEQADAGIEVIVVDTTESPIQRPKERQEEYYSGKKNGTP